MSCRFTLLHLQWHIYTPPPSNVSLYIQKIEMEEANALLLVFAKVAETTGCHLENVLADLCMVNKHWGQIIMDYHGSGEFWRSVLGTAIWERNAGAFEFYWNMRKGVPDFAHMLYLALIENDNPCLPLIWAAYEERRTPETDDGLVRSVIAVPGAFAFEGCTILEFLITKKGAKIPINTIVNAADSCDSAYQIAEMIRCGYIGDSHLIYETAIANNNLELLAAMDAVRAVKKWTWKDSFRTIGQCTCLDVLEHLAEEHPPTRIQIDRAMKVAAANESTRALVESFYVPNRIRARKY